MRHIKKTRLSAFLDGELSIEERAQISKHLKACPHCRREVEELSKVSDFLGFVEEVGISPHFFVRLRQRIAEQESRALARLPFVEWVRRAIIPVGAAVLFLLSILLGSHLGTVIYHQKTAEASYLSEEFRNLLGISLLDDLPEGSLSSAYADLLREGGE